MFIDHFKNRYQASLAHLAGSAVIACAVLALVFGLWYPGPLAGATGVTKIFLILLLIDVCLGPLLTLVVFNTQKKELSRDLLIILILQLSALGYGMYTVSSARPAYIVFSVDRFELVQANELTEENLAQASIQDYKSKPLFGAKWVSAQMPTDVTERNKLTFDSTSGGYDLAQLPRYYMPYSESKIEIIERAKPLNDLKELNAGSISDYEELLSRYSSSSEFGFLPLSARFRDLVVVVNKSTAEVAEVIALEPW